MRLPSLCQKRESLPHNMDIGDFRQEYTRNGLNRADLDPSPFVQFERWFTQACEAGLLEPNAMSLATAAPSDQGLVPTLRTVLLKSYDERGFVFYTHYESDKARQIALNPHVALLFPWIPLERQVILRGLAERVSRTESLRYFVTRPRGSQIGAWVSPQSSNIPDRSFLEMQWEKMKAKFAEGAIPIPDNWGGIRVVPQTIEFWQGRPSRLHDRFLYTRQPDSVWQIQRLAP